MFVILLHLLQTVYSPSWDRTGSQQCWSWVSHGLTQTMTGRGNRWDRFSTSWCCHSGERQGDCCDPCSPQSITAPKSTREREQQLPARRGDTNPVPRLRVKYVSASSTKSSMFSWAEDDTSTNKPSAELEFSFYLQICHLNCVSSLSQTRTPSSPIQETGAWGIISNHMPRLWACHCCGRWVKFGTSRGR